MVNLYYQVKKYRSLCKGPCIGNVADTWGGHFLKLKEVKWFLTENLIVYGKYHGKGGTSIKVEMTKITY